MVFCKVLGVFVFLNASLSLASWDQMIIDTGTGMPIQFEKVDVSQDILVLGEKHYSSSVQKAEASWIRDSVNRKKVGERFTLAWEFLTRDVQSSISASWSRVLDFSLLPFDFLNEFQPKSDEYLPVFQATQELRGNVLATNLTRAQKAPVVAGGLSSADPSIIPPGFEMGSEVYRRRFYNAMGDHATPDQLDRYFQAQCLTDDVMAYSLEQNSNRPYQVLIVGSFHSDYSEGVVSRIRKRIPNRRVSSVHIFDASDVTVAQLSNWISESVRNRRADYLMIVNEPLGDK